MSPTQPAVEETDTPAEYLHEVPVALILKHPKNPRHRAIADPDMVASVKAQGVLQPLGLAPHPDKPGKYMLLWGHRRVDACKKASRKTAPAVVRHDLVSEAQQIEAMLVENGRREDLTPIEEAEGYAQLELLGYKAQAIASAVGRDVKTVRSRLKLLKLSPATRKKVHAGQMTIEDAAAFVEFASDPDATKSLEESARYGDIKGTVRRLRQNREAQREAAKETAKLLDAGATEIELKKDQALWSILDATKGPVQLSSTFSEDWGQHKGCLGVVTDPGGMWSAARAIPVCTDPASHPDTRSEEEIERAAADEKHREEHAAQRAAAAASSVARVESLLELVGIGTILPPAVRDLLRALAPGLIADIQATRLTAYQEAMNIPEAARWSSVYYYEAKPSADGRKLRDHLEDVARYSDGVLTRVLVALLAAKAEDNLRSSYGRRLDLANDYLDLLREAGHTFSDVDTELQEGISTALNPSTGDESTEVDVA